ncbi:uncharacterized protein TRIADDRAFT_54944 [Trichoplax adhaerens]|uniref:Dynamin N-terminal domain-containing protein n=1 Tax=Trichoplax adhaerens TaxID=10228 RepID=B3RTF2_TRIAD|nr:predicted protein [Trichoplax adhaerens]EDV27214.1 predicted protein [Trichoplax adhaerens]|eukprot:XP_002111210.1 predicted protein [Trichoplax adhaerens]
MASAITKSEIDEIKSARVARNICKKYNIDSTGTKTLQDFKDRLDLFRRDATIENYKSSYCKRRIQAAITKFEESKLQVINLSLQAKELIFQELQPEIVDIVNVIDEHYLENINNQIANFYNMKYPILVAGEVSAGKSSLINLILGKSVLPVGHLHTTKCICQLHYSIDSCLKPFIWNKRDKKLEPLQPIHIDKVSDLVKKIKSAQDLISKKKISTNAAEEGHSSLQQDEDYTDTEETPVLSTSVNDITVNCDLPDVELTSGKIEVHWSFDFLKDGIFLVDSPGIGETSLATQQLVNYLPKACSLVYVINPSNAGGILEDRLVRLLRVAQNTGNGNFKRFSPESAIFICNKWDLISDTNRPKVEESIKKNLKRLWPGFHDSQLILLSSQITANHLKAGYISDDLKTVYSLLSQLLEDSLKKTIVNYSCWLDTLLKVVAHRYRLLANCSRLDQKNRISYLDSLINNTSSAKTVVENQDFHIGIEKIIDDNTEQITTSLLHFFNSNKFKFSMTHWTLDDIPIREKVTNIEDVISKLIDDRFIRLLTVWEDHNNLLKQFYVKVRKSLDSRYEQALKELDDLENKLAVDVSILNNIQDLENVSSLIENSSYADGIPSKGKGLRRSLLAGLGVVTGTLSGSAVGATVGLTIADGVGAAVVGGVIGGATAGIGIIITIIVAAAVVTAIWSASKINRQTKRILHVLEKISPKILSELAQKNKARQVALNYTNPVKESIENMRRQMIRQVEANETLINQVNQKDYSMARDIALDKISIINKLRKNINDVLNSYDCGI